jgi:hypothetical protein
MKVGLTVDPYSVIQDLKRELNVKKVKLPLCLIKDHAKRRY